MIRDVHSGIGNSEHSKPMASHRGKNSTNEKIGKDFFGTIFQMILVTLLRSVSSVRSRMTWSR